MTPHKNKPKREAKPPENICIIEVRSYRFYRLATLEFEVHRLPFLSDWLEAKCVENPTKVEYRLP
jgi:hypothetical protein